MPRKEVERRPQARSVPVDLGNLPSLKIADIEGDSVPQLQARAVAYVKEYARVEKAPTILLKNIAAVMWTLRMKHDDPTGRSQKYRDDAAEVYRTANIPTDSESRVQAAVRWHIGNLVREELPADELKALVLRPDSPAQRQRDKRAVNAAILKSVGASVTVAESTPKKTKGAKADEDRVPEQGGHAVKATADHLRLAGTVGAVLRQLDVDVIDEHMTDGQRAKLDEELASLQEIIRKLRRHTRKRSSGA